MDTPRTIGEALQRGAALWPDAPYALAVDGAGSITHGGLLRETAAVAVQLHALGLRAGDTVSLVMPNGLHTLRCLLGAMASGLVVNPVNLLSQPEQMRYVLGHSDCKLVITTTEWEARVREHLGTLDRHVALLVSSADAAAPGAPVFTWPVIDPQAVALLMYTSGTTGQPKGVMLSQANLVANALAIAQEHALTRGDRVLAVLPLFHINAFAVTMLAPLLSGGSLAMPPRFSSGRFWAQVAQAQCTWINLVPTMISFLLEGETPPRNTTAALRFCRSASAALPPEHLRGFEQRFGVGVIETMGLTETVAPCFSNPLEATQRKLGSVGRASGCEARVIDAQLQPVPDGTTGELAMHGANVMLGYYKNPEATAASFTPDGWLRSGDLGHRDADGFFFVTGRIKELIIKGGENIAPREIDEALLAHPAVLDAAAVGIPDRHYGQEILACVVLREGHTCSEDELRAFSESKLGRYKTPKQFRFVSELPRGPSGKVQRLKLLDWTRSA